MAPSSCVRLAILSQPLLILHVLGLMCRGIVGQMIGDCGQSCSLLPVHSTSKYPSLLSHLGVCDVGLIAAVLKNELFKNQKTGFLTPAPVIVSESVTFTMISPP